MTDDALELDGSAGGGQLLRTALGLSLVTGRPFRMANVRGDRPEPGLKPQHLAAVRAATELGDATVDGAAEGAEAVTFRPGSLADAPDRVAVDVGTAGSVTLVFDAVLPAAVALDHPVAVTATGGTDVKWSPTAAHYRQVKLRLLRRAGAFASVERARTGFYPAGGGRATLSLAPSTLDPLDVTDRGAFRGTRIYSTASADLAGADVARRQAESAAERLRERLADESTDGDAPVVREQTVSSVETASTGSAAAVALDYEGTVAGYDALGERGKPAEEVGAEAAAAALSFHETDDAEEAAAVDAYTADQFVVWVALAGGRVAIPESTDHVRTSVDLVNEFGLSVDLVEGDPPALVGPESPNRTG